MYGSLPSNPAREAFENQDPALSKVIHDGRISAARTQLQIERHAFGSEFVKSAVYGAMDGVLTAFAVVSGSAGGNLSPRIVAVLGLSGLIGGAISMAIGDAVSTLSYQEHVADERAREEWEFENFPEGEVEEMVDLYESRGLPRDSAQEVVEILAKYKELFLDIMVTEELGLKISKPEEKNNYWKGGLVSGVSFFSFGLLPLLAYVFFASWFSTHNLFVVSVALTCASLFLLGALKSKFTCVSWWRGGLEFVVLGGLCALAAFGIGSMVSDLVTHYEI